ncbi:MAG: hypothetical protein NXI23_26810 [Bacteroidetes bacterium]|nr:hypothetical protein [Bacteroidota bacterium]
MKSFLIFFQLIFFSIYSYAFISDPVPDSTSVSNDESEIIFIRNTGTDFWLVPYKTFINDELVCKINHRKYFRHKVAPGTYNFAVQFSGKKRKGKTSRRNIEVLPRKKHFILIIYMQGIWTSEIDAIEINEETAMTYLKGMKKDKD